MPLIMHNPERVELISTPLRVGRSFNRFFFFPPDWHPGPITCRYSIPIGIWAAFTEFGLRNNPKGIEVRILRVFL
jgi:hypothetical protein